MARNIGPSIVRDNLVLCLDAANTKSYPGSGTAWTDISGNGNNAILTHSPTHTSGSGGYFTFDGANDYATITDSSDFLMGTGSFTEEAWHKRGGNTTWEVPMLRGKASAFASSGGWGGLWINDSGGGEFNPYHYTESSGYISFDSNDAAGTDWMHHVTTTTNTGSSVIIKVYKNSVLQGSQTTSVSGWQPLGTSVGDDDVYIGGIPTQPYWYEGKIAICRLYKGKALTAAEVKQNYNATKGRFGL